MKSPAIQVYQDRAGGWRWRLVAGNGATIADGAEAYAKRAGVVRALDRLYELAACGELAMVITRDARSIHRECAERALRRAPDPTPEPLVWPPLASQEDEA